MKYEVYDNIAGQPVRSFDDEEPAAWLCRSLNLQAGPGGRYGVRPARGPALTASEQALLRLVELITRYAEKKFGDEWWPGNAEPYLGADQAAELDRLLADADSLQAKAREPQSTTARFGLDESRLADVASRYPVEDDHGAFLALETAILGECGDPATAVITGGPCDLAVELLADANGEPDGYRLLIHPHPDLAGPWIASHIERVSDRDQLAEPTEDGGIYDTEQIIRDVAVTANELVAWGDRHPAGPEHEPAPVPACHDHGGPPHRHDSDGEPCL